MKLTTLLLAAGLLAMAGAFTGPARADEARLAALPAPVLASPSDGTVLPNMGFIVLNWVLPSGATQYQIQVTPSGNDGPGINLIRDAATTYTVEPPVLGAGPYVLLPGMSYTWRVRTTDSGTAVDENHASWGAWSEPWRFRTPAPTSDGIRSVSPAPGASVTTLTPRLTWSDTAGGLFYYQVQLTKDAEFRTTPDTAVAAVYDNLVHGGLTNPVNSWAVPAGALEPNTTYFWRVRPRVQGDGTPAGWSSHFSFATGGGAATPTPAATFVASPTATPAAGSPTITPTAGSPTTTPTAGSPTATPGAGTPTPSSVNCNWTGTWGSNAGGDFGFQHTGSQATGVFNGVGLTIDSVNGGDISGRRAVAGGWTSFTLIAGADCQSYTGTLFTPKAGTPPFELSQVSGSRKNTTPPAIPTPVPATPAPTPVPCNWTGNWDVKQGVASGTGWTRRLALTQSGSSVTGTIDGTGSVTAAASSPDGRKLTGSWTSGSENGTLSWSVLISCAGPAFGQWDRKAPTAESALVIVNKVP